MRISTSINHGTLSLKLCGRLDFSARHALKDAIQENGDSPACKIILDLEAVSFIDSAGLGLIYNCITDSESQNMNVVLCNPQRQVHDILELCNMAKYISTPTTLKQRANLLTKGSLNFIE